MRDPKYLIIDPDSGNRRELAGIFNRLGHTVDQVPDPSVLGKLEKLTGYDCIIIDRSVDSAYRSAHETQNGSAQRPLVFLTGSDSFTPRSERDIGSFDGYIPKNIDSVNNLTRHVRKSIGRLTDAHVSFGPDVPRCVIQPCTRLTDSYIDSRIIIRTSQVTLPGPIEDIALAACLGEEKYSVLIGDATGPASIRDLTLMYLKPRISMHLMESHSPSRLLEDLNTEFIGLHQDIDFLTAVAMHLDISKKILTWSAAGHQPPLYRPWGSSRWRVLKSEGIPLGIRGQESYNEFSMRINPGAKVLLLSDGILKINGASGGITNWDSVLGDLDMLPVDGAPTEILDGIEELIRMRTNGDSVIDEVTAMLIQL